MQYYNNITELIGNTPMLKLNNLALPKGVNLFAKLEFCNPGGSVKDRIGHWIIQQAEAEGKLKPGYTIIEATAGNTGIGLALAAVQRGYQIIFVVPNKFSMEKQVIMRALGTTIVNTPTEAGLQGAFEKVEELKHQIGTVFVADQFNNGHNPQAHYLFTGREIFDQLDGQIDCLVAGAGSGGTITGVMRYLRERLPNFRGVLADPVGSTMGGGQRGPYAIEGIGNDFTPATFDSSLVDEVIKVNDQQAFTMVSQLARREGLLVGSSSGAAVHAALRVTNKLKQGNIVVILPDRADRYLSKGIFD